MTYAEAQMFKVAPYPIDDRMKVVKLKLHSEHGQTNWIDLKPETVKAIELALINQETKK